MSAPNLQLDTSPTLQLAIIPTGNAPPSPPDSDDGGLNDIYGSSPTSPILSSQTTAHRFSQGHEILSDLPSRERTLNTDAYREGLSESKGKYVQEGFDEGFALGANIGQKVGYILGVLEEFAAAMEGHNEEAFEKVERMREQAEKELDIAELLGKDYVDEEGVFKWEVRGEKGEEPTLRDVADQHPVIKRWGETVTELARGWGVDLKKLDNVEAEEEGGVEAAV